MADNNEEVVITPEEEMTEDELAKLKEDEEFILNFKEEDKQDDKKVERLDEALKNAKTTINQKRHYRDKLAEVTKGKDPKKPETPAVPPKKEGEAAVEKKISPTDILNFRFDHNDIPKEVVDEIAEYAEYRKISLEEAMKTKVVQKMVQEAKRTEDVEDGVPPPSRRTGGQFVGDRDWSNASPEEMDKARNRIMYPKG